jgi:hypothetical protein
LRQWGSLRKNYVLIAGTAAVIFERRQTLGDWLQEI